MVPAQPPRSLRSSGSISLAGLCLLMGTDHGIVEVSLVRQLRIRWGAVILRWDCPPSFRRSMTYSASSKRHSASYLCGLVLSSASLIAACCSPGFCSFVRFWCLSLYWSALVLFYGCYFRRGDVAARIEVLEDWHFDSFALSFLYWLCCVRVCLNKRCHIHSRHGFIVTNC